MPLLALVLLPLISSLGLALVPRDPELTMIKPTSNSLNLHPLPNPFPVPGTDITLQFLPLPAFYPQPSQTDIIRLFDIVRSDIEAYIRVQGDGPIMEREYLVDYGEVEIALTSSGVRMDPLTYGDALTVLLGVSFKLAREGYRNTSARVFRTGEPQPIGFVAVYRIGIARDSPA